MLKNDRGLTAFHYAAASGSLVDLPSEFLTRETLTLSSDLRTPL